ncbi:MAG TPA: hypothetical protein PLE30_09905 [Candidatus Kapabacteria bacterium]|nr:hypothetical protein [Candidatus Kapabacteria bacterium]
MFDFNQIKRFLPYEMTNEPISIVLKASEGLVVGAEFKLYKKESLNYLKTWKIGCQDGEETKIVIERDTKLINKHALTWQVLCCVKDVAIYDGIVHIDFFQGDRKLRPNIPTLREMQNLPPCAIKRYNKFTEALLFVARI